MCFYRKKKMKMLSWRENQNYYIIKTDDDDDDDF